VTGRLRLPGGLTASERTPGLLVSVYWLWEIIKAEFHGAILYFEDEDN